MCLDEVKAMRKLSYKHETESRFGLEVIHLSLPLATPNCGLLGELFLKHSLNYKIRQ